MRSRGAVAALLALLVLGTAWRRRANPFYSERGQDRWVRDHLLWGVSHGAALGGLDTH